MAGTIPKTILFLILTFILGGCQSLQTTLQGAQTSQTDHIAFMNLWSIYSHCQEGLDLDSMRDDANRLHLAAQTTGMAKPPLFLPELLKRQIAPMPSRLAADPKAMAAACTLYTGQAALHAGRPDVATEMFKTVVQDYPQQDFAYYVAQARTGLSQVYLETVVVRQEPGPAPAFKPLASAVSPNELLLRPKD